MKTKILSIFLSVGVFFALAIGAHAQNLYVSVNGAVCGFHCSDASGSISEYTPDGTQITFADRLARPRGLAFDSSGAVFVGVNYIGPPSQRYGRILKFPPGGQQSVLGNVPRGIPEGLVTDTAGNTFALAQSGSIYKANIYKFAPD